jgi:hypothetical protein
MRVRDIIIKINNLLHHLQGGDPEPGEVDLYREEFAPDDPVLLEIRAAAMAREAAAKGKKSDGESAAA